MSRPVSVAANSAAGKPAIIIDMHFLLINTIEFPCIGTHYFHVKKFLSGFQLNGFSVIEVNSSAQEIDINSSNKTFAYISNHGINGPLSLGQLRFLEELAHFGVIPVVWYGHDAINEFNNIFSHRWVLTGEKFNSPSITKSHAMLQNAGQLAPFFVPTRFAAAVSERAVGRLARTERWLAAYAGARYQKIANLAIRMHFPGRVKISYAPPFLDEGFRLSHFLDSRFSLGWHSVANRQNGVVGERIFEALAFGSLPLTDSRHAEETTDGLAQYVTNWHEACELIQRLGRDEVAFSKRQELGFAWSKSYGTYQASALHFLRELKVQGLDY
jgi:hypothetical protein